MVDSCSPRMASTFAMTGRGTKTDVKTRPAPNIWLMFVSGVGNRIGLWIAHKCWDGNLVTNQTRERGVERAGERTGPVVAGTCETNPPPSFRRLKTSRQAGAQATFEGQAGFSQETSGGEWTDACNNEFNSFRQAMWQAQT